MFQLWIHHHLQKWRLLLLSMVSTFIQKKKSTHEKCPHNKRISDIMTSAIALHLPCSPYFQKACKYSSFLLCVWQSETQGVDRWGPNEDVASRAISGSLGCRARPSILGISLALFPSIRMTGITAEVLKITVGTWHTFSLLIVKGE